MQTIAVFNIVNGQPDYTPRGSVRIAYDADAGVFRARARGHAPIIFIATCHAAAIRFVIARLAR